MIDFHNIKKGVVVMKIITLFLFLFASVSVNSQLKQEKKTFLWLDARANFERLGTKNGVVRVLNEAKSVGFTNVVLDLKGIDGYVLYPSRTAPVLREHEGFKRASDYDYPAVVLNEARKLGLGVYFSVNVFSEGDKRTRLGAAYQKHPDWQVQVYTKDGIIPISKSKEEIAAFVNPILPVVRNYEFSVIEELLKMYLPDGIILDRARYPNISGDFSTASKEAFEKFIERKIDRWPEDVYKIETIEGNKIKRIPGTYYKPWLEWRAKVIYDFFKEVRERVKKISPKIAFANYVGAWYPIYYDVGVNWASNEYRTDKDYEWATNTYHRTGYAQLLDFLFVGNYFYDVTEEEAIESHTPPPDSTKTPNDYWWYSVKGSAKIAKKVVDGATPVCGSLYVQQYLDKNNPEQFVKAMKEVLKDTDGLMIFDIVHIDKNNLWKYVKEVLKEERSN